MSAREPARARFKRWFKDYPFTTWTLLALLVVPLLLGIIWWEVTVFALVIYGIAGAICFVGWVLIHIINEH